MSGSDTDEQNFGNIRAGRTKIGGTDVALTTLGNISETQDAATFWKCRTHQQHFGGIREGQGTQKTATFGTRMMRQHFETANTIDLGKMCKHLLTINISAGSRRARKKQRKKFAIRVSTLGLHLLIPEHDNSKTNVIELRVNDIAQFGTGTGEGESFLTSPPS